MFAVTVTITLKPGARDAFLPVMLENARLSREEPACQQFDVCSDPDAPDTIFLYEIYDDAAGFQTHKETKHFLSFDSKIQDLVIDKKLVVFSEVLQ